MFWSGRVGRRGAIRPVDRARAPGNGAGSRRVSTGVDERGVRWMRRAHTRARTSTHRPPPRGQFTASRETGTRLNRGLTNQRLRKGRLRQARLSRLRVVSAARRGGSREQAEDSLQNFKVGIVSHLLPRPDAVLLHGVAERLLLLIVPVPSERHFEVLSVSTARDFAAARARPSLGTTRGTFAGYRAVRPSKRQSARRDPIVSGLSHRSAVALRAYSIAARERARKGLTVRSRALISTAAL